MNLILSIEYQSNKTLVHKVFNFVYEFNFDENISEFYFPQFFFFKN
jgi:hypothetical protein